MKPYYQDDVVTIYHGDCREIMTAVDAPVVDALVADPPYGISIVSRQGTIGGNNVAAVRDYLPVWADDEPFGSAPWLRYDQVILWGGNYFADKLPPSSCWLVWDKKNGGNSDTFADCELAWTNLPGPARLYHHLWRGMIRGGEPRWHPTQKPLDVMRWCVSLTHGSVLDPFMGSGTTLRAAKDLGRRAIGIEIEEKYCEIAAKRMGQEVLAL